MQFDFSYILMASAAGLSLAAAAACVVQTVALRKRVASLESRTPADNNELLSDYEAVASRISSMQGSINILQSGYSELQNNLAEVRSQADERPRFAAAAAADGGRPGRLEKDLNNAAPINLNRRGQLIRMHRRGESISSIASALGISQGEVKLTIRMQEVCSELPEKDNSHDRL